MVLNLSAFQLASAAGIAVLFPLFNLMLITLKEDITTVDSPENEYDYIVVGGGTSGALIASKLASQSDNKVLLVEAGGKVPWFSRIPAAFQPLNQQIKSIDWLSWTEPQTESLFGYIGQKTLWHRGKVLGGSSGINGMVYYWPAPEDMDSWADRFNDPKWKFENMQKHFRNIEDTEFVDKPSRGRGRSGGIRVQSSPACQEPGLCQSFLEAAQYKGHPVRDINSAQNYGFMPGQATIYNGRRWTSVQGYLEDAAQTFKDRLHVLINSMVTQVLFENKRATSVKILMEKGRQIVVKARKEIILSAGAINTPQLLMLSGIGPKQHLAEIGIPLVQDLPVGDNLLDHMAMTLHYNVDDSVSNSLAEIIDPRKWIQYFINRSGVLGTNLVEVLGRLPRPNGKPGDINFFLVNIGTVETVLWSRLSNYKLRVDHISQCTAPNSSVCTLSQQTINKHFDQPGNLFKSGFIFVVMQLHTQSRGLLRLKSSNPLEQPIIDPRYFENEVDLDTLVEGIRIADEIMQSPSMQKIGARLHLADYPECRPPNVPAMFWKPTLNSTHYLKCWLRQVSITVWHAVGTAKMGRRGQPDTVVDPDFRVVGVEGLRVVDASIFPEHVACNPMGTILGIADLGADVILQDDHRTAPGRNRHHQDQDKDSPWDGSSWW